MGFFYGDTQNQQHGGGATLYLSDTHYFHIQMGLGTATNNYIELTALRILICFASEKIAKLFRSLETL